MKTKATPVDLTEAHRLITEAVKLEKQARELRDRAAALTNPERPRMWTAHGAPSLPARW